MHKQRGVTVSGMIAVSFILVLLAILSFKVIPVYLEYQTIQRLFRSMAEDPGLRKASKRDFDSTWAARTSIDNVKSLPPENIEFTKDASGVTISADYAVKVPLFRNVSLYFEFHPTSQQ
jgi:hypothetical protein